jgi:hypothetical protein
MKTSATNSVPSTSAKSKVYFDHHAEPACTSAEGGSALFTLTARNGRLCPKWSLPKLRDVLWEATDTTDFVVTFLKKGTNLTDVLTTRGSVGVVEKVLGELRTAFVAHKPALVNWLKHGNNLIGLLTYSELSAPGVKQWLSSLLKVLGSQEAVVQFLLAEEHLIRCLRRQGGSCRGLASRIQDVVKECPPGSGAWGRARQHFLRLASIRCFGWAIVIGR